MTSGPASYDLRANWNIVLASIAGISLLVGGIGIFSVMQISISERTYEIGLRKSIVATDPEIFGQFLTSPSDGGELTEANRSIRVRALALLLDSAPMALAQGTLLGPYRVVTPPGADGMARFRTGMPLV